jgi:hypothetical protein
MKLSLLFRLIFLVVLFGSTLAGCIPATEGTVDIYNAAGRLVEPVKNQYSGEKGTYKVVIAPGQSIEVDTFTVTKSDEEPRLAYSEFNFTLEGSEKSKLQAVTAIF